MIPPVLFGPFALTAGVLMVLFALLKRPPIWYPASAYDALVVILREARALFERMLTDLRTEYEARLQAERKDALDAIARERERGDRWERLALSTTTLAETLANQLPTAERDQRREASR